MIYQKKFNTFKPRRKLTTLRGFLLLMNMPFGKFKGLDVSLIDSSYLIYCLDNYENLKSDFKRFIKIELHYRYSIKSNYNDEKLNKTYRKLAMKFHPDKGGNSDSFIALNEFYNELKES